jgi:hypothetical protein
MPCCLAESKPMDPLALGLKPMVKYGGHVENTRGYG